MEPQTRLLKTLKGETPDRIPIYTLVPYAMEKGKMIPGPFCGYEDIDDWRRQDPMYWELVRRMEAECDNIFMWLPRCIDAQNLFFSPSVMKLDEKKLSGDQVSFRYRFDTGNKMLYKTEVFQIGSGHKWVTEHFCKTIDEAMSLLETNWDSVKCEIVALFDSMKQLGNKGIAWVTIPSPVMTVCRLFDPQDFLLFSALYTDEIEELMQAAFKRTHQKLVELLAMGAGPIIRFGGAEHATPPMMSPADFDRLVVAYDKPLMDICHEHGCMVAVHCHGNIRHAVKRFMEMGVDQIDPVEALPWGDISLEDIREITKDQITLTGNIQFSEICDSTPDEIKKRVHGIIKTAGHERLIISTTGTPLEKLTRRQYDNYNAMIDAVLEYGW